MAISIVQLTSGSSEPPGTRFATSNFTAGNTVLFFISSFRIPSSVTIAGLTAVLDESFSLPSEDSCSIWRAENMPSGRNDVDTVGDDYGVYSILEVSGLSSNSLDVHGDSSGVSSSPSAATSGSTTVDDELVIACWTDTWVTEADAYGAVSPSGYSNAYDATTLGYVKAGGSGAYRIISTTGTQTATFDATPNTPDWGCAIATYKAGASVQDNSITAIFFASGTTS